VHSHTFDISTHQINARFLFIAYLYHVSPTCFGVSHTIFSENLRVLYSKTHALTQLLSLVQWLCHKM